MPSKIADYLSTFEGVLDHVNENQVWIDLRQELARIYFKAHEEAQVDPEVAEGMMLMAEAVLAYDVMTEDERVGESGSNVIQDVSPTLTIEDVREEWQMLKAHRDRILKVVGQLFKRKQHGEGKDKKLSYSSMAISGLRAGVQGMKEVCFVPSGMKVKPSTVNEEILAKDHWSIPRPSRLLKLDCGTRHPAALSTPQLLGMPAFENVRRLADEFVDRRLAQSVDRQKITNQQKLMLVSNQVDDSLQHSLGKEIIPPFLAVARQTNSWIFVDRSSASASSPTAELLLENSLDETTPLKPTVLVFDSFSRYANFKPSRMVNMQLLILGDVLCRSMGDLAGDEVNENRVTALNMMSLYQDTDFQRWEQYHVRNPEDMLGEDTNLILEGNRRLPRHPEEEMIQVDDNGEKLYTSDGRPLVTPQLKWVYHYRQYFYNTGSHYVIFENAEKSSFSFESDHVVWPEGHIFAHGGNLSFQRIQKSLLSRTPTVMLYNTGGVTQTFGSLCHWCCHAQDTIADECERTGKESTNVILDRTDVVSTEPWTRKFGAAHVSKMQALEMEDPEMKKSLIVIDALQEAPERIVRRVLACFDTSWHADHDAREGGTNAEDLVLKAWQYHMMFTENARVLRRLGDLLHYVSLVLGVVAVTLAISVSVTSESTEEPDVFIGTLFKRLLLIIPLGSSIMASIITETRFLQNWGAMKTASAQLVSEIYAFRIGVKDYDPQKSQRLKVFATKCDQIHKFVTNSVAKDKATQKVLALLEKRMNKSKVDFNDPEVLKHQLLTYVPREVLGQKKSKYAGANGPARPTQIRRSGSGRASYAAAAAFRSGKGRQSHGDFLLIDQPPPVDEPAAIDSLMDEQPTATVQSEATHEAPKPTAIGYSPETPAPIYQAPHAYEAASISAELVCAPQCYEPAELVTFSPHRPIQLASPTKTNQFTTSSYNQNHHHPSAAYQPPYRPASADEETPATLHSGTPQEAIESSSNQMRTPKKLYSKINHEAPNSTPNKPQPDINSRPVPEAIYQPPQAYQPPSNSTELVTFTPQKPIHPASPTTKTNQLTTSPYNQHDPSPDKTYENQLKVLYSKGPTQQTQSHGTSQYEQQLQALYSKDETQKAQSHATSQYETQLKALNSKDATQQSQSHATSQYEQQLKVLSSKDTTQQSQSHATSQSETQLKALNSTNTTQQAQSQQEQSHATSQYEQQLKALSSKDTTQQAQSHATSQSETQIKALNSEGTTQQAQSHADSQYESQLKLLNSQASPASPKKGIALEADKLFNASSPVGPKKSPKKAIALEADKLFNESSPSGQKKSLKKEYALEADQLFSASSPFGPKKSPKRPYALEADELFNESSPFTPKKSPKKDYTLESDELFSGSSPFGQKTMPNKTYVLESNRLFPNTQIRLKSAPQVGGSWEKLLDAKSSGSPAGKKKEDPELPLIMRPDDFVEPMTIESYIEYRAKPLLELCNDSCRVLARRLSNLEMLVIVILAAGTLLSALDHQRWVAVTVALGTALSNIIQHEMLQQRLFSTSSAKRDLTNNQILMNSLTAVARRTPEMKTICVHTVEKAILETTVSWTGMTAKSEDSQADTAQ